MKHREVERVRMKKGFEREFRDQVYFVYYSFHGVLSATLVALDHRHVSAIATTLNLKRIRETGLRFQRTKVVVD